MPIYEYECESCGERFETLVSRARAKQSVPCQACGGGDTRRVMSGFSGRAGSEGDTRTVGSPCAACSAASCAGCRR